MLSPSGDTSLDVPAPQAFGPALCVRLVPALPSGQPQASILSSLIASPSYGNKSSLSWCGM